jgi:putative DNA primase/helicase
MMAATSGGKGADGLMQRFPLFTWPDVIGKWKNVDEHPNTQAKNRAYEVFKRLSELDLVMIGANVPEDGKAYLRFSSEAQDVFNDWLSEFMNKTVRTEESEALESHFAKYPSLVPSLALIFHLVDQGTGPVRLEALERALKWVEYLESHARRLYAHGVGGGFTEALALSKKVLAGDLGEHFAARDVYRKGWRCLTNKGAVNRAIDVLVDHAWLIKKTVTDTGGRNAEICVVNPKVPR